MTLRERFNNLKFDLDLIGAQLGITRREEVEPAVRKLLAAKDKAEAEVRRLRAILQDQELG